MRRSRDSGQILVLGALLLFVLTLSILSTVRVGHAVHGKLRLQDAADASAYSTAVVAARSLNGMAWVNRTMVSQYVAAMSIQSMVSALDGLDALLGVGSDKAQDGAVSLCRWSRLLYLACIIPPACNAADKAFKVAQKLAEAVEGISGGIRTAQKPIQAASRAVDAVAAPLVSNIATLNRALFEIQRLTRTGVTASMAAGVGEDLTRVAGRTNPSDRGVGIAYRSAMGLLNATAYRGVFDTQGSEAIPKGGTLRRGVETETSARRAEQLMAELANASRTTFESDRNITRGLPPIFKELTGLLTWALDLKPGGATRLVDPMSTNEILQKAKLCRHKGVTCNRVFMNYGPSVQGTRGNALVASEFIAERGASGNLIGPGASQQMTAIQSSSVQGERVHCRYGGRAFEPTILCPNSVTTLAPKCDVESRHEWAGITPYLSLAPHSVDDPTFHQPSFHGLVFQTSEDARFSNGIPLEFAPAQKRLMGGVHAWAKAQAYYHRPRAWAEPPNLFNPFWRAKLEPLRTLPPQLDTGLGRILPELPIEEVLTH